ncbi:MAG: TIR domain-containing protein [Steroidobacteraceae bacterium]
MPESGDSPPTRNHGPPSPDTAAAGAAHHDAFVSYASADAAIANGIVAELERHGMGCWIAPRDVPAGAPYADGIIQAINEVKILVLVLSESAISSSHVSKEVERASSKRRPIITLRTDTARLTATLEYFLSESQWIDFEPGRPDAAYRRLVEAAQRLIANPSAVPPSRAAQAAGKATPAGPAAAGVRAIWGLNRPIVALIALVVAALVYVAVDRMKLAKRVPAGRTEVAATSPEALAGGAAAKPAAGKGDFSPPAHSIAVLPFVNMSGDPKQDYFSDGLSEELLNSLARVNELHVAARTSSFSFKGKDTDIPTIARKLNVGAVVEGSVRRAGDRVRITAQLINAITDYDLWSQTYDRDVKDIFALQTEIAEAVTAALKVTLLEDATRKFELGGTKNPQAFDAYLRGVKLSRNSADELSVRAEKAAAEEAIRLDPNYALAEVLLARALDVLASQVIADPAEARATFLRAKAAAETAIRLSPQLGEAHAQLGSTLEYGFLDFGGALAELDRAIALAPGSTEVQIYYARIASISDRADATAAAERLIGLDPLNPRAFHAAGTAYFYSRRFTEAIGAFQKAIELRGNPGDDASYLGYAHMSLGRAEAARADCVTAPENIFAQVCLAIVYHALNRQPDAEALLAGLIAKLGDAAAFQYAEINAQWARKGEALKWLATAVRLSDPGLATLHADPLLDPLRREPQFKDIERRLHFP